jgi:hypothetical protein
LTAPQAGHQSSREPELGGNRSADPAFATSRLAAPFALRRRTLYRILD